MADTENKYAVPVDALVRSAHVPLDEQIEEHPEPPTPDVVGEQQVEEQRFLRYIGTGAVAAPAAIGGSDSDSGCD